MLVRHSDIADDEKLGNLVNGKQVLPGARLRWDKESKLVSEVVSRCCRVCAAASDAVKPMIACFQNLEFTIRFHWILSLHHDLHYLFV